MKIRGRIAVLPDKRKLILGQDLSEVLEKGVVYEIIGDDFGLGSDIVLSPIGEYALPKSGDYPNENSRINAQIMCGLHIITKKEQEEYISTLPMED